MSIKVKYIYLLFFIISILSLITSYVIEHILGHYPCILCVYQRFPYLVIIFLALIHHNNLNKLTGLIYTAIVVFCNIILASYHSGIELGFFELSDICNPIVKITNNLSVSDFQTMLYNAKTPLCNKATIFFFKLSMAQCNLILNMLLLIIIVVTLIFCRKKNA